MSGVISVILLLLTILPLVYFFQGRTYTFDGVFEEEALQIQVYKDGVKAFVEGNYL